MCEYAHKQKPTTSPRQRRLKTVAAASAVGLLALGCWALLTGVAVCVAVHHNTSHSLQWWPHEGSWVSVLSDAARVVPVLLVALICQYGYVFSQWMFFSEHTHTT